MKSHYMVEIKKLCESENMTNKEPEKSCIHYFVTVVLSKITQNPGALGQIPLVATHFNGWLSNGCRQS